MLGIISIKIIILFVMLLITFIASMAPLLLIRKVRNVSDERTRLRYRKVISLLSCFAGGVFMGTCIMDLFPDVQKQINFLLKFYLHGTETFPIAECIVVSGFLLVLTVEQFVLYLRERNLENLETSTSALLSSDSHQQQESRHTLRRQLSLGGVSDRPDLSASMRSTASSTVFEPDMIVAYLPVGGHSHHMAENLPHSPVRSVLLLVALSFHSVFEGLAVGLQSSIDHVVALFVIVILHKGVIAFSLGLQMVQSNLSIRNIVLSNTFFSITAPLGVGLGVGISSLGTSPVVALVSGVLQGIACGTFLYVTFFEVLPHEMNCSNYRLAKTVCVILGFATVCGLMLFEPNEEIPDDYQITENPIQEIFKLL